MNWQSLLCIYEHDEWLDVIGTPDFDIQARALDGSSWLWPAIHHSVEAVEAVLRAGVDPNRPNDVQHTALMEAVLHCPAAIAVLAQAGARFGAKNRRGETALILAALRSTEDAGEALQACLQNGAQPGDVLRGNHSALVQAAGLKGSREAVQVLLEAGADPNQSNAQGITALMAAVRAKNVEAARLLLAGGADARAVDEYGTSALHRSAQHCPALVGELLDAGADPNALNGHGATPVMNAARYQVEGLRTLLARGGRVDVANAQGQTALMWAARHRGDSATLELLLAAGASLDAVDASGRSAYDYAGAHRTKTWRLRTFTQGVNEHVAKTMAEHLPVMTTGPRSRRF